VKVIEHSVFKGVESERCASFSAALKAGKPVYTASEPTLADGTFICLFFRQAVGH